MRRLDLLDLSTGITFPVKVPDDAGWLAWGTRMRVAYPTADGETWGALHKSSAAGLDVEDAAGNIVRVRWSEARLVPMPAAEPANLVEMSKAALKPGQRWISVHPGGPDTKGVPVLIQPNPDGTHRIIAGAGGKLTHLNLKHVGPPMTDEQKKAKAKESAAAEKDRTSKQSDEEKKSEKDAKKDAKEARHVEERAFIEKVRGRLGGVREDLNEEHKKALREGGLNDSQVKAVESAHHRAAYKDAKDRAREVLTGITQREVSRAEHAAISGAEVEDEAALGTARDLARMALDTETEGKTAAAKERQQLREKLTGGDPDVRARAATAVLDTIKDMPDADKAIGELGEPERASTEMQRRALVSLASAQDLAKQAETATDPDAKAKLALDAAQALRKHEIDSARADRLAHTEMTEDDDQAGWRALAFTDSISRAAKERGEAVRAGLVDTVMVGARDVDLAEAQDVARDFATHQKAQRELRKLAKAAETPEYDAARRAFDLRSDVLDTPADLDVADEVRRNLTERLLGTGDTGNTHYQQAVGAGHHDALADISQGIDGVRHVDRLAVDALGPVNAAHLLRYALEQHGHGKDDLLAAVEGHHVEQVTRASTKALERAEKVAPGLSAKLAEVGDFEQAAADLHMQARDIKAAQSAVGGAIGQLEASAALGQALRGKPPENLSLDTKRSGLDSTLAWLHAAGLRPGDYAIDHESGKLDIPKRSWDKLLTGEDRSEATLRKDVEAIKRGAHDQPGWLPPGIVRREESTFTAPSPTVAKLEQPLDLKGADTPEAIQAVVEAHAGSRLAEGQHPADVMSDLLAADQVRQTSDPAAYVEAVKKAFPILGEDGQRVKLADHAAHFQGLADKFMVGKYGTETGAFHAQDIHPEDPKTREAVFRTLAEQPEAAVAFKPLGELNTRDQRLLRDAYYKQAGIDPKSREDGAAYKAAIDGLGAEPDPNKGTMSMFGPRSAGPSPEWREFKKAQAEVFDRFPRSAMSDAVKALGERPSDPEKAADHDLKVKAYREAALNAPTAWDRFVGTHGSLPLAQKAMQDEMRGRFLSTFVAHHGKVTGQGIRHGVVEVTNAERHVKAMATPEEAEALQAEARSLYAKLRERQGGKFAGEGGEGALAGKFTKVLEQSTISSQNQLGMFGARPAPAAETAAPPRATKKGERVTIGERAENQIASLMGAVGGQFEPGKPVGLFPGLNMDGPRVDQQRVLKHLGRVKRLGGFLGVGSGKSLISISGYTQAHAAGEAKHGLFLVPAAVQSQFGAEMLRYTEPGKYKWATGDGKSHAERVAMLKDPSVHMRVFTHQSYRDTAMRVAAEHHKKTTDEMRAVLDAATPRERAAMFKSAFDAEGIPQHYVYYDEAHTAEARTDSDLSTTHLVRSAVTHPLNASHYLHGTATPIKNDTGEMWSTAAAIDPDRYGDRTKFLQNFGQATAGAHDALRRELAPRTYTARIEPEGVRRTDSDNPRIENGRKVSDGAAMALLPEHQKLVDHVADSYERAKKAHARGDVDLAAMKTLSPKAFADKPPKEHEALARSMGANLGLIKEHAMRRAINGAPTAINTKIQAITGVIKHDLATNWVDKKGKPRKGRRAVTFTDRATEARQLHEHLLSQGVRSAFYHGGLTAEGREKVRLGFQPEDGSAPIYDHIVATASAEAGVNLQAASVIHHFDVAVTDKSANQRAGRAFRQGQLGDVDVHSWHTDTDFEKNARGRLRDKGALAQVLQDPIDHLDEHGIAGHYRRVVAERQAGPVNVNPTFAPRPLFGGTRAAA